MQEHPQTEVSVQTSDGRTHSVTLQKTDKHGWKAEACIDGQHVAVAGGLNSLQHAVEKWKAAYPYRFDD